MKRHSGVVTGVVKSFKDPEGEGRLGIEFPWLKEKRIPVFAPLATSLAGKEQGMFFMPELGDEVLVAFEHGDFDHPFIVGFLWNGVDKPPESDPKNRVIVTPGGHTLRFEDGDNKKIMIKSSNGHEIVLDDSSAGQTITLKTKGLQKIVMDDKDQSIEIRGGGRMLAMRGGQFMIT